MIPLSVPNLYGNELKYVKECIETGWISSAGNYVNLFEKSISDYTNSGYAVACMNGTAAIQTALNLLNLGRGDYVLTTNLTFVATLNAISYTGAEPILFDIDESTWQIDLILVENWLEENTKLVEEKGQILSVHKENNRKIGAVIPVHVLGGMVDIEKLLSISEKFHIPIVEDSTEALGSKYLNKYAGTFGTIGTLSFNGNKIISTGGGGMLLTKNALHAERARHITTTAKVDPLDYFHDEIGYNYRLVNVLAAIGVAQMENFPSILERKKSIDKFYRKELNGLSGVSFQEHIKGSDPNCWLFTFKTPRMRELLEYLNNKGIQSRPFWTPMNQLPMYSNCLYINSNNITNKIYRNCISIPSSSNLTSLEQEVVVDEIINFFKL